MRRSALLLIGLAGALIAVYLLRERPRATEEVAPPARRTAAGPAREAPQPPVSAARVPPVPSVAIRAALLRHFHGAPPARDLIDRLVAGEVGAVARTLESAAEPGAAAQLLDLLALCEAEREPDANGTLPAEHDASVDDPASRELVEALVGARHAWRQRLAPGCAALKVDRALLMKRLAASAARGDATSLERLAALEPAPLPHLMSAALLGSARAEFRLALEYLPRQPELGRSWLQAAAKGDADAAAYLGACLLNGCFGAADPAAARAALESAARAGASAAIGLLASGAATESLAPWSGADALVVALVPRDPEALGVEPAQRYAWAALAEQLARAGCFGFDVTLTGKALGARARLEPTLRPAELAAARAAAAALATDALGALRRARGCD